MVVIMEKYPTLEEEPRRFLSMRANRLHKLCELKAPALVIRGEVKLVNQAMEVIARQENVTSPNSELLDEIARLQKEVESLRVYALKIDKPIELGTVNANDRGAPVA